MAKPQPFLSDLPFCFDTFSLREPPSTSLENALISHGAARWKSSTISGTGVAGPDSAAMKALNPAGLIRMGAVSISTSSAARTAASRTKSVRERPRSAAGVLDEAFSRLQVTYDPVRSALLTSARSAYDAGFLGRQMPDLSGMYDLTLLNQVLVEKGKKAIQ